MPAPLVMPVKNRERRVAILVDGVELTLPKAVLLLQPLFKCWPGRCRPCQRRINVDRRALTLKRHDE